mmetsp:Transcript_21183/g.30286  ORF Transcript_21183/g.30286 Transcript_21183/m.30286 type:complete len:92 (+) Transcript_21183:15-290(+)
MWRKRSTVLSLATLLVDRRSNDDKQTSGLLPVTDHHGSCYECGASSYLWRSQRGGQTVDEDGRNNRYVLGNQGVVGTWFGDHVLCPFVGWK